MPDGGKAIPPYKRDRATRWLRWLAQGMRQHGHSVFLLERLQPSWLPGRCNERYFLILFTFTPAACRARSNEPKWYRAAA